MQQVPPLDPEGAAGGGGGFECVIHCSDHKEKYIIFCLSAFKYVFSDVYVKNTSKNTSYHLSFLFP